MLIAATSLFAAPSLFAATALETYWPFVALIASVSFIIVAIAVLRMHAFVALIGAALLAGAIASRDSWSVVQKDGKMKEIPGMVGVVELTAKGLGDTARDIAISVAFASIIGMCLMQSWLGSALVHLYFEYSHLLRYHVYADGSACQSVSQADWQRLFAVCHVCMLRRCDYSLAYDTSPGSYRDGR